MKICIIAHLNDLSGANRSLVDLVNHLILKNEVLVIVPREGELSRKLKEKGIPYKVILSGMWVYADLESTVKVILKYIINFFAEIRYFFFFLFNKFDIVHYNSSTYGAGARSLKLLHRKYTWHIRELAEETFNLHFFNKKKSYELINNSEHIITISKFVEENVQKDLNKDKISVVYNGIEIPDRKEVSGICIKELLFVGAINFDKGQLIALKAMKHLLKTVGVILPIIFLGKITNPEYKRKLEEYIKENQLEKYVTFEGYKQDISAYRNPSRMVLVCSEQEAFGRVTIEAMANQEIVIGNNAGATPEIIQDGKFGYLYDGTYEDLANKIATVVNNENQSSMINDSYIYAKNNFSIERTAIEVEKILKNVGQMRCKN